MNLSFKDREHIIKKFADEYNKSKIIELKGLDLLNEDIVSDSQECYIDTINKYRYYYSLQNKIDRILEKLDWDTCCFIKREFFTSNHRNDWWMNYYSRSTYYRLKKKSMEKFLGLLYD